MLYDNLTPLWLLKGVFYLLRKLGFWWGFLVLKSSKHQIVRCKVVTGKKNVCLFAGPRTVGLGFFFLKYWSLHLPVAGANPVT